MAPAAVPTIIEIAVTPKPTMSEMRMPVTRREKRSRPTWSVPSRCPSLRGGRFACNKFCLA
jgi:hypothetical protein